MHFHTGPLARVYDSGSVKAGKDVYVEKPSCVYVEEGQKMVQAARKYKRVVQAGTMQRSGGYFQKAPKWSRAGASATSLSATLSGRLKEERGRRQSPDTDPPAGLDWDMWLGPAPKRAV